MNTINPLQIIPATGKIGQPATRAQQPLQLLSGQILKAEVLESLGSNRFLIQAGENQFTARSEAALRTGQTLQLQLTSTTPELQFKIVDNTVNQFLGKSLSLIGNTIDIGTLFTSLQQPSSLFDSLSLHSRQALENLFNLQSTNLALKDSGSALKQAVENLGLSFENLLTRGDSTKAAASLKAALFEIIMTMKGGHNIQENASRLLSTLEFFQLAQLHTDSQQQFIFPLPFSFIEQGYLLAERKNQESEGSGNYDNQEYRFSLHLKLTEIGNLRIDFFHTPDGLFIRFHTESEEISDFISGFKDQLKNNISDAPILGLSFAADAQDPAVELARLIVPDGKSVLDTTA